MNRHGERMALFHNRVFMVCLLAALLCPGPRPAGAVTEPAAGKVTREANYGALPLLFIPNKGQYDPRVAYAVQGRDKSIFFTGEGLTMVLSESAGSSPAGKSRALRDLALHEPDPPMPRQRWTVKLDFVDANPEARPESLEQAGTVISYFKGQPAEWRTGLQASRKIIYRDLWPGIDLIYSGTVHRLKYDFIVHPGADPARIRLACRGADGVAVTSSGQLELTTPLGTLRDEMPKAWQEREDGRQEDVAVAYALNGPAGVEVAALASGEEGSVPPVRLDPSQHRQVYGFTVGDYDRTRTLVLDPEILVYCGFLGGSNYEKGFDIALDAGNQAFVTGATLSTDFGGGTIGDWDIFIAKVRPDGKGLIYCTLIGGLASEWGSGVAVDKWGYAYVVGQTASTEKNESVGHFPIIGGPDLTYNGGFSDAFIAKISPAGSLVYCGYIGGNGDENFAEGYGVDVAVDGSGYAYISGMTSSNQATFPVKVGPDLTFNGGYWDAFVAKVSPAGSLVYCGYIGGSDVDNGRSVAVDPSGHAYVAGYTTSTQSTFPVTIGPDLTYNGGLYGDAFVAKVKADGSGLDYCGYIGGSTEDKAHGIAVDGVGSAYITGVTNSSEATFPVKVGPSLTFNKSGYDDAFVAKVNPAGTALVYCGYLGGTKNDLGRGIAVDGLGNAYVTGRTLSTEATFPVKIGPDLTYNSDIYSDLYDDAFVAKIKVNGSGLDYCGYIGGIGFEEGWGVAVSGGGDAFVAGGSNSTQSTFPVTVGPDLTSNGSFDAFVVHILDVPETAEKADDFPWEIFLPAILKGR